MSPADRRRARGILATGPLGKKPTLVLPGELGGVETPMAYDGSSLYVPIVDLGFRYTSSSVKPASKAGLFGGTGQLVALDPTTGAARWTRTFTSADYGAATVSHNVVTSTLDGKIYALSTKDDSTLWSAQAPAGVNAFPAIDGKLLLVGAAAPVKGIKHPSNELVAYSLP